MRFSQSLLDDISARLPVSQVVSRRVKLKRHGREYIGLSPFKSEKTPSFTVNDQKGFFHCFASGEHGNIFTFLMKTEGLSFPEAVEQLASEAGVALPAAQPQTQKQEDERAQLYKIMEAACQYFVEMLSAPVGREASDYLQNRGVSAQTQHNFQLGYAPNNRSGLKSYLQKQGFAEKHMITAGLLIAGEDIATPYDRFRNRVMFPICDFKGRVIAFGGRTLDPDHPAKYLNSPETPLFHKGHTLFNAHMARQSAYDKAQIIVVEGYMDVIALADAGFHNAVAPLGTALTSHQIQTLWRFADEPVLCFDGDSAGKKAAFRAVETALPFLQPGKSLCFSFLPDGLDPDDLVKQHGDAAMEETLNRAVPLADVLWDKEWSKGPWTTPERKAALEKTIYALIDDIKDAQVKYQYTSEMKRRFYEAWRPQFSSTQKGKQNYRAQTRNAWSERVRHSKNANQKGSYPGRHLSHSLQTTESLANSPLVQDKSGQIVPREALLLLILVRHPWLLDTYAEELGDLSFTNKIATNLRDAILHVYSLENSLDITSLDTHLNYLGYKDARQQLERAITHKSDRCLEPDADHEDVVEALKHLLNLHRKQLELKKDLAAAIDLYHQDENEENFNRLCNIRLTILQADAEDLEASGDFRVN